MNKEEMIEKLIGKDINVTSKNDGWISVDDRLPEEDKEVLICSRWGTIDVGWHYDTYWGTEHNIYEYDGDIVAWMPLPEPYKKGENR